MHTKIEDHITMQLLARRLGGDRYQSKPKVRDNALVGSYTWF